MRLVTDQPGKPAVVWQWMNKRTRLPWSSDLRCIASMRDDGTIACAVAYNAFTYHSCWMHVAFESEHTVTRQLWRAAFEYPFIDCGLDAVYGLTPKGNEEALAMNKKLGFKQIAETVDCVMFELKADDCRWINRFKARERVPAVA